MDQPPLRATDEDREHVLALLRQASVDGRLTVEELAERAERAQEARTHAELTAITGDLVPGGVVPPSAAGPTALGTAVERHRATLSTLERAGRWRIAPRSRYVATLGSVTLDLRQAVMPGPEVEIELKAVMGSAELLVPPGTDVRVSGGNVLGACELRLGDETPAPGAPVVHVRMSGTMGAIEIRCEPRLSDRIKQEARRLAERLMGPDALSRVSARRR